jgi:5-methylcytosine-specific restriction enzyme subunit McrC
MKSLNRFTIFEHQSLIENQTYYNTVFTKKHHQLLESFYKEKDFPYYTLIRKGVRFCEYVGVLQIGNLVIEVLPKADKNDDKNVWRKTLIEMLKAVGVFNIHAPSASDLKLKTNSILDLYFELFLFETELLLHKGLIKRYRRTEGNTTALKGNIQFSKHIQQNLTHQERFYVCHTTYDREHPLNCVLFKTLKLLHNINTNKALSSRIGALLLNFPEMLDVKVSDAFFEKINYTRKTEPYKKAIDIAQLLLLNYHPDVISGKNDILALMFDMNILWEQFVYASLKKNNSQNYSIKNQVRKHFWQKEGGYLMKMIPDIVIEKSLNEIIVLDTKWKNIGDYNPSPEDLRQMYAYSKFHRNAKTALVYPSEKYAFTKGHFFDETESEKNNNRLCGILTLSIGETIKEWQKSISDEIFHSSLFE